MNSNSNLSVVNELEENCMQTQPSILKSAKKITHEFSLKNLMKKDHLGNQHVHGKIVLQCFLGT
jgi:hypothetical protein